MLAGGLVLVLAVAVGGCDRLGGEQVEWPPQVPPGQMVRIEPGQEGSVLAGELGDISIRDMAADGQGRLALTGARESVEADTVWLIDADGSVRLLIGPDVELPALPEGPEWPYLSGPAHVAFAPDGTVLFLEDIGRSTLRAVDPDGGRVRTLAGTGKDDLFQPEPFDGRAGDPLGTRMSGTMGLGVADDGRVFISDSPGVKPGRRASRVWVLDRGWSRIGVLAGPEGRLGELAGRGAQLALDGEVLWVLDSRAGVASRIDLAAETIDEVALQELPDDSDLFDPVPAPDGGLFAIGGPVIGERGLWHIDPGGRVREVRTSEQLGGSPGSLATDGDLLYVGVDGLVVLRAGDLTDPAS